MILYRPVGHKELELICDRGCKSFPPRLPEQPIFYPVLNAGYAREIAEGWNSKSGTNSGYITRFNIDSDYSQRFGKKIVGGKLHEEFWVPAEDLEEFNKNIFGHIEVIAAYFGKDFIGSPPYSGFSNKSANAKEFLQMLLNTAEYNFMDFSAAIVLNYKSVFCNFAFWKQIDQSKLQAKDKGMRQNLIPGIVDAWNRNFSGIKLPTETEISEFEQEFLD